MVDLEEGEMIGEALKAIRRSRGLTQEQAAGKVGVAASQWSSWETGRHAPQGESLVRLCEGLGVEAGELMGMRLERDAVIVWLVKQLGVEDRAMVIGMLEEMVNRRGSGVGAGSRAEAVVRPKADEAVSLPVSGEIVLPGGQD